VTIYVAEHPSALSVRTETPLTSVWKHLQWCFYTDRIRKTAKARRPSACASCWCHGSLRGVYFGLL